MNNVKAKRLKDIRYFESVEVPSGRTPPFNADLLDVPTSAQRMGQRIACVLESENFSVGTFDHVYITLTPAIPENEVVVTDFGFEPWHRYVAYGTPRSFKARSEDEKLRHIETGTFEVLRQLRPPDSELIEGVRRRLAAHGARTRVLRAAKETKGHRFEVWFDVPALPEKAYLYVVAQDKLSGESLDAPPIPLAHFEDIFPLVSTITYSNGAVNINPRKSLQASFSTSGYESPIRIPLSQFSTR